MNLKKRAIGGVPTLTEQVDGLIQQYIDLDSKADQLIEDWIAGYARKCPGVPTGTLRLMELDARSHTYSHRAALERLRGKLQ
ncbi:MAG TPA: hypothetical protein VKG24_03460 [Pseudolabrys sp.]|nr:hypothetical protein [Pseudolabrys sp.]